ncbi:MAG TPA: efflux RND transporter periplasmic adaptor subunit [Acidobacteriota bacterium]|nr:efflux RND transporter periplasmic adaptor subunit [Acidobacteriota bacterium]
MRKAAYALGLLLLIGGAFVAGSRYSRSKVVEPTATEARKILYYTCPMHPAIRSEKPGTAPCCGMNLEPVYADAGPAKADVAGRPSSGPPGTAPIGAGKQQLIGVTVSPVEKLSGTRTLRLFGRVVPEEGRVYRLNAGIEGFIREVSAVTTGSQVRKNQLLATFSAPMASSTIQTYILNLGASDRFKQSAREGSVEADSNPAANANVQYRADQMQNVGMSPLQMEEIKQTRQVPSEIKILSPADGFVLSRNVSPGLKFDRGAEWYRIADLSRVWVLADVFENEAHDLRTGVRAQVSLPTERTTLGARVAEVLPQFDAATRTLKVRLEADNPGYVLRPDMFVDVELPVAFPPTITVPVDSVLDSGLRRTVFVERGEGDFEPRQVETGWRFGDRVEIVKGLTPGERIVVSGTFFLDSESRMKAASAGPPGGRQP